MKNMKKKKRPITKRPKTKRPKTKCPMQQNAQYNRTSNYKTPNVTKGPMQQKAQPQKNTQNFEKR